MRRRTGLGAALVLAILLLAIGLVVSRPLAVHWADALPVIPHAPGERAVLTRAPGDSLQLYYELWLFRDGLLGATPLFWDPYQFRTDGPRWNLPQSFLPLAVPFALLSPLGPHGAYNLLVLLSFPLAGLSAYILVRRYTGHGLAAVAAGLAYALVPARLEPLFGGQPAGFAAALPPLVLWGLDRALLRGSLAGGATAGAAVFALATLEPHYAYLVAALVPAYVVLRWATAGRPAVPPGPLVAFALPAAAGAAWLWMLRQTFLLGSIAEAGRSLGEVRLHSPGPAALLVPATYGGVVLIGLALLGLVAGAREARALRLFYGALLIAGLVLGVGPTLPGLPLYQALHRWVPLFTLIRNPEKFRLMASLGAAVLAGWGVGALTTRLSPPVRRSAAPALLVATIAGTAPWHPIVLTRIPDSAVHAAIRAEARRVLYLPLWPGDSAWSSIYLYTVTRTRVPMLNGYSPMVPRRYVADVFAPLQGLNVGDLGLPEHALLRRLGVTHVVLDRALFPPQVSPFPTGYTLAHLRATPGLVLESAADPLWLFRVTDRAPVDRPRVTSPVGLFFEAEALPRETGAVVDDPAVSGGRFVAGRPGIDRPGFLTFGPYRLLPAAAYQAVFRVRGSGLTLEVTVDQGRRVLAERPVEPRATWDEVELPFELDRAQPVEYRVRWNGRGEAAADWVSVAFAARPQPEWGFEVEDLPHRLGERADPAASGGRAGYADPVESFRTDLVSGPARLYPAGRYRVTLFARADRETRGPLLRLAVTEPQGRLLAARTVDGAELRPGRYREVGLDFVLTVPMVLEFPVGYLGDAGVFFDRLAVAPR